MFLNEKEGTIIGNFLKNLDKFDIEEMTLGEYHMNNNDWRLTNQKNYLYKKSLIKGSFKPYREGWEHEHCAFCSERIDSSTKVVYSTEDRYHWICEDCFKDFKDMFEWILI